MMLSDFNFFKKIFRFFKKKWLAGPRIRAKMLHQIRDKSTVWDVVVIGGGASGLGVAVESASRGYRTLLLEQFDFAQCTSSRSTKLIHGGVRYLQQGNISLVIESLHERGLLFKNAPHLVRHQSFIVPTYTWWQGPFYGVGLKFYDLLAGKLGLKPSKRLSREKVLEKIPTLSPDNLRGGIIYYDGQFDDARLAVDLALTVNDLDSIALNYIKLTGLQKINGIIIGINAQDQITGEVFDIRARAVINATGIFVDQIQQLDDETIEPMMAFSQGIHLVLDRSFLPGDTGILVPNTEDGRVLFVVPWNDRAIIGTTDTPIEEPTIEPKPQTEEIDFLLSHAAQYLTQPPTPKDVLSVFAGIRPLVNSQTQQKTASLSRDHQVTITPSGLITISGGKWTTFRKMGEETIERAIEVGDLPEKPSYSAKLRIHGWVSDEKKKQSQNQPFAIYGADAVKIKKLMQTIPDSGQLLHPKLPYRVIEIIWAIRYEMAVTLQDLLVRRTRALILDARASMEIAPKVASILAKELGQSKKWEKKQLEEYLILARNYILE